MNLKLSRWQRIWLGLAAILYPAAGLFHFIAPALYLRFMPGWVPYPLGMIYFTGVAEVAGGVGLLIPSLRRKAAYGLVLLLIAVFPVNVKMALDSTSLLLWVRLPIQGLLIWWILWCTRPRESAVESVVS